MNPNDIRKLSHSQQIDNLKHLKEELFNLRFQLATGQLENPMRIKQIKRTIAKFHTIIHESRKENNLDT